MTTNKNNFALRSLFAWSMGCTMLALLCATSVVHADDKPAAKPTSAASIKTYTDEANGFSIDFPAKWKRFKFKPDSLIKTLVRPTADKTTDVRVTVSESKLPPEKVKDVVEMTLKLAAAMDGGKTVSNEEAKLDGAAGRLIVYTKNNQNGDGQIKCLNVVVIRNDRQYALMYSAPEEKFDDHKPEVDEIIKSFRWVDKK